MASKPLCVLLLTFIFIFIFLFTSQTKAQAPAPALAPAPAPTLAPSGTLNLTTVLLEKGSRTVITLFTLLKDFQLLTEIQSQLNSNSQGITLFAATDNAFRHLNPSTFSDLTNDQKLKFFLYHVTPKYYTIYDLRTMRNPVRTLASEKKGSWVLNFTNHENRVKVATGVVSTPLTNIMRQQFPLAIYEVDEVLFPLELVGDEFSPLAKFPKS